MKNYQDVLGRPHFRLSQQSHVATGLHYTYSSYSTTTLDLKDEFV